MTIARKARGSNEWFIGAITDDQPRIARVELSFLDKGATYVATIYRDAPSAHWEKNPKAYLIERWLVNGGTNLELPLAPGGGAAVSLRPASENDLNSLKLYNK